MVNRLTLASVALLAASTCALALNPALDIKQYSHASWNVRDGFFKGAIITLAQTPDGYLWVGTEYGLLRFDGVRAVPWQPPGGQRLPNNLIYHLFSASDGTLWIGFRGGIASWKAGKFRTYGIHGQTPFAIIEDPDGTIWTGGYERPSSHLCAIRLGKVQCYGQDGAFGLGILSLYRDGDSLWVAAQTGLWRWKPGSAQQVSKVNDPRFITPNGQDSFLIADHYEIRQFIHGGIEPYPIPGIGRPSAPSSMLRDRDGALWIATNNQGLLVVHPGHTSRFEQVDGLSGNDARALFEDREGNIWVATSDGLDRFRDFAITEASLKPAPSNLVIGSLQASGDGSVWLGGNSLGLSRWKNGLTVPFVKANGLPDNTTHSFLEDNRGRIWVSTAGGVAYWQDGRFVRTNVAPGGFVHSMAQDKSGDIWINEDKALVHVRGDRVLEEVAWPRLGGQRDRWSMAADPTRGGLWFGLDDGAVYFNAGHIRASYSSANGLGAGIVAGLRFDGDGALWAATQGGLSRIKQDRIITLSSRNGLPCDTVHWSIEDNDRSLWLLMACGLVRVARPELDAWLAAPTRTIQTSVFDNSDGVRVRALPGGYSPAVTKAADGRIWFTKIGGVSVLDPRHLPFNKLLPPVHIEQITADGKPYDLKPGVRLPALVRDISIDYTALSLMAPEKIHFKYKLEGQDQDWKEVVNRRQAQYSNLAPRNYSFRVIASNNSGVWNQAGDTLDFSVAPAYYQTGWFRASIVAALLLLIWALYRYRVYQIAREYNVRLDERVEERIRIARELHDTLLQSFQGLMLRFQTARNLLPARPAEAVKALDAALDRADQAIVESRNAIQNIRSSTLVSNDLAESIRTAGNELAAEHPANFRLLVEGPSRDLHPLVRDDVYRIAREAIRNAFLHAQAQVIEAEITYGDSLLRLRVRDDGKGMDAAIANKGRPSHYGLAGMRERAAAIEGQLSIWSGEDSGTEVELKIPASMAYANPSGAATGRFRRRGKTTPVA